MTRLHALYRSAAVIALGLMLGAVSCSSIDELLEAQNPAAIDESQLDDVALVNVLTNSVVGALTASYADPLIWRSSMLTDEVVQGINWEGTARTSQRIVRYDDEGPDPVFTGLSRYRFLADSIASRFRTLLADPHKNRNMALVLTHGGYAYTLMAEHMCEAALNVEAKKYTPVELAALAVPRFREAIDVATALGGASGDSIRNLARTGLARAYLLLGKKDSVMAFAGQVPATFTWWVEYKLNVTDNPLRAQVNGANHNMGVHPRWLNGTFRTQDLIATQTDPRIQHTSRWTTGHNALTPLYKPYQSLPFSGFNANNIIATVGQTCEPASGPRPAGCPSLYVQDTDIKLASGLEALHHYYEAAGPNGTGPAGTTLEFVNARRAFGKQAAVTLTGDALMSELRTQRFKDLYLGGFRLGDLRRYLAQGINDPLHTFPSGPHVNASWGNYGDAICWPIPLSEYVGNPKLPRT
jgi:hypothetical protein